MIPVAFDWDPVWLTARLAATVTVILLCLGIPLACWLATGRSRWRPLIDTLVAMPLVLPPSVLGFYLLLAFNPAGGPGSWLLRTFGISLVFSFPGLVVGSVLFSLPFMVQPVAAAIAGQPASLREAAYTLGTSRLVTFVRVVLPAVRPAIVAGAVMTFAHTVGEFGLVLMIGGNLPGSTRVASIAIYDRVEALDYATAHAYAALLCAFSFAVLLAVNLMQRRAREKP